MGNRSGYSKVTSEVEKHSKPEVGKMALTRFGYFRASDPKSETAIL